MREINAITKNGRNLFQTEFKSLNKTKLSTGVWDNSFFTDIVHLILSKGGKAFVF